MKVVPVILAGGSGTRLWPLSKSGTPKQFLRLFGDGSLLQDTVARIQSLGSDHLVIVTGEALCLETRTQLREMGIADARVTILTEPCARNTAPAAALAAAFLRDEFGPDTRMVVLPADHHISDPDQFCQTLGVALQATHENVLVTLGIEPTEPATGYGYIQAGQWEGVSASVKRFVEKPNGERARQFLSEGGYYWNSGMFVWTVSAYLDGVARHMPELDHLARLPWAMFCAAFEAAPNVSVDYGLLEHADNVRMITAAFPWSDVGTWDAVTEQWHAGEWFAAQPVMVDAEGVDVFSPRDVAVIGLDDVLVVDTAEGVLVMKKGCGQQVGHAAREVVRRRAQSVDVVGHTPRVVPKPWGQELIWAETPTYVGKTLSIHAGESLSLQYHRIKDETIHVLRGELLFRHGKDADSLDVVIMHPGESFHIGTMTVHQMEAVSDCEILEVSTPHLDDVVRLVDRYGRAPVSEEEEAFDSAA